MGRDRAVKDVASFKHKGGRVSGSERAHGVIAIFALREDPFGGYLINLMVQGILMKEAKIVGEQVAIGMYGPASGAATPGVTPARTPALPTPGNKPGGTKTPGTKTPTIVPVPATPAVQRQQLR